MYKICKISHINKTVSYMKIKIKIIAKINNWQPKNSNKTFISSKKFIEMTQWIRKHNKTIICIKLNIKIYKNLKILIKIN